MPRLRTPAVTRARRTRARRGRWVALAAMGAAVALLLTGLPAGADDTTVSYDNGRTGWDQSESGLAPSSVSASDFGQLFSSAVNGQVYAQPLVANGNLIVATENNYVYGMNPVNGAVNWSINVGPAWPAATVSCGDLTPNIGITGTPVYDAATNGVYFAAKIDNTADHTTPHWILDGVDATTGATLPGFPTTIGGSPSNVPTNTFNAETEMQRPGLLLMDGVVYAGFGSHCDSTPYLGYVVGVNATTAKQTTMWADVTSGSGEGGIWQSGGGLTSDGDGRIIVVTGNGVAPAPGSGDSPPANLGESVVRLQVNTDGSLTAESFFSPYNAGALNQDDEDLGSGGAMALPASFGTAAHPHLAVVVGKDGRVYLLDADHLGGSAQGPNGTDDVVGEAGPFNGVWGHPAFWGGDGGYVYTVGSNGPLRALKYSVSANGTPTLSSVGTTTDDFGYTSGSPVVTSSGSTSGSALVWVVYSGGSTGAGGQLRAYNPVPVNGVMQLVYSAPIGTAAKFAVPGTDSGRVYVGTRDGHVLGFGRPTTSPLTTTPFDFGSTAVGGAVNGNVTVTATRSVTISGVTADAPFSASPAGLPVTLSTGQTYTVPVSYTPSTWGSATGNLTFTTGEGTTAFGLHGNGTQPGLGATPSTLDFGQVRTGANEELGVDIVNTGTATETITGVTGPSSSVFTTTNLPAVGSTLAPGASTVITVTYTPTTGTDTGVTDTDQLSVTGDAGSVTVPLTGVALTGQPMMTLSPASVDFGIVPVGGSVTKSFTVSNTGTVPLTVTKAKAPTGAYFTNTPLSEGQILQPGDSITQSVTYTATSAYPQTAAYYITGNDGQGEQTVNLTGNMDPIAAYYQQLGGSRGSYLSDPVTGEYATANGGEAQDFRGGSIYWSPATGAHAVHGVILTHYKALGGPASALGYPTTDEQGTPDGVGRYNHFNGSGGASIYWTPSTGAWAVYGAIRTEWAATGWERGPLGYPTSDETGTPDGVGRFNHFAGQNPQGGSIYWTPNTGAHAVYGAIRAAWAASGWERGPMGYPTTDEQGTPDGVGRYNHFAGQNPQGGSIYWTPNTGAHLIYGLIRAQWAAMGWERSWLGYPTSDEYGITGGRRNNFQHGTITFYTSNGAIAAAH